MSFGGSPGQQTTTTSLPAWAEPYAKKLLGKAEELTDQSYQAPSMTPEMRVAGFTPMEQQVRAQAAGMGPSSYLAQGAGIAGQAGQQALGAAGQYRTASAGDISSLRGAGSMLGQQLQPGISYGMLAGERLEGKIDPALQESLRAGRAYQQMATDPSQMAAYMSPYLQNVVDIEKREAQRQADIAATGRGAQAVRAGAFGGSRQAIMENEAERNLQQQLGDIQARGLQSAFERAQQAQQFGSELGLRGLGQGLQAQQAASQLGLSGVGQSMQAQQAAADLGLRGTQAALAGTQFGSELGIRGAQAASQAAQALGGLGATEFDQQRAALGFQRELGQEERGLTQAMKDIEYEQEMAKQRYPYEQLGFMADMLRGVPVGQTAQSIYRAPSSGLGQQLLGAALTGKGFNLFKEGGNVSTQKGLTALAMQKIKG